MENSIKFFLNTHLEWSLSRQDLVITLVEEGDLKERIKRAQKGDKKVVKAVEELKKMGIKMLKDKEWKIKDRIVMKEGRIYVLEGELRGKII